MTLYKLGDEMFIEVAPNDHRLLRFDQRSPCADCPFRNDVPIHEGTVKIFAENVWQIIRGEFVHSCHKTDPRSDDEAAHDYKGPIQHCAGAMVMLQKSEEPSNVMVWAESKRKMNRRKLNLAAPVDDVKRTCDRFMSFCREKVGVEEVRP